MPRTKKKSLARIDKLADNEEKGSENIAEKTGSTAEDETIINTSCFSM